VIEEKNSLLKIKKEQNKALDFLNNEGEYERKVFGFLMQANPIS